MKLLPISLTFQLLYFRTLTTSYQSAENYGPTVTRITPYKTRQGLSWNTKIQRNAKELNWMLLFVFIYFFFLKKRIEHRQARNFTPPRFRKKRLTIIGTSNVKKSIRKNKKMLQI